MKGATLLALIGVLLAAMLGYAAHVVAQDTIALPAVSLESERPLAPAQARPPAEPPRVETQPEPEVETVETGEDNSGPGSSSSGSGSGDDSNGRGRGRGRGGDD